MKYLSIPNSTLAVSAVALGCMRIAKLPTQEAATLLNTALDAGINFFDHADIYGGGKSEEKFAEALGMKPAVREKLLIQSKCGIRQGFFDFSKEHILAAVDGSLQRLQTDYLDVLLLHRPDALVEPEEVAEAFTSLQASGKVRYFGVSNQNPMQIALLQKFVKQPLLFNQLQLSITNTGMIDAGLNVNMEIDASVVRDGSILDYCRLHEITIQPWSPFQYGFFEGVFLDNPKFPELNQAIDALAAEKGVTNTTIAVAWLLRHPANMQPIIGTTTPARVQQSCQAADVTLTRQEWYAIYRAAGNKLP
ncbi:MAG: aldo/keto reductase [Caldilineaceae bacterium]|nr:aldo/keto reductase [Caldilineaceae bacterium]